MLKRKQQGKYISKVHSKEARKDHVAAHPTNEDDLNNRKVFE